MTFFAIIIHSDSKRTVLKMTNLQDAIKDIKSGKINSIYLLYGTEQYFIDQFKHALTNAITNEETVEDIVTTYDLLETSIQDVMNDAETIPFFTDKKIIFAENAVFLKTKPDKLPFTHDLTALETYLEHKVDYTIFILIAPYEKIDERKKITKLLKQKATVINCNPIHSRQLKTWIIQIAKENHITLTEDTIDLLEAEFSTQLHLLNKEIEKLALFVGKGGEVTKEIAQQLISTSLTFDALELVDAVLRKDLFQAIKIYRELMKRENDNIGLIALLAYQFRTIFQVKLFKQKGYPNQRIQSELKIHPYVVKLAAQRSANFQEETLMKIMEELTETDAMIKQGKVDKDIAFELLLFKLTEHAQ